MAMIPDLGLFVGKYDTRTPQALTCFQDSGLFPALADKTPAALLEQLLAPSEVARTLATLDRYKDASGEGILEGWEVHYHCRTTPEKSFVEITVTGKNFESYVLPLTRALTRASFANHRESGTHLLRLNLYSGTLAGLLGLQAAEVNEFYLVAELHDVGKISLDRDILEKKGPLNAAETERMKRHTTYGAKIIGDDPRMRVAAEIAKHHHEKWDGSGYPSGLAAEDIPLPARIVALVDVFDALVSRRAYKDPFGYDRARSVLTKGDERICPQNHFDPKLLHLFLENYAVFVQIHQHFSDSTLL